ncbi:hypothetical protein QZH41_013087 [Actinostola sp. cb2023]|nr:hypothetical protein QZH41_013087 [Actinostola sp. cb2023]
MYRLFLRPDLSKIAIKGNVQRRYQWTGPNYARGVLVIAVSAVIGAMGASNCKYGAYHYFYLPIQGNSCGGGYHKQRSVQKKPRSCLDHLKRGSTKCGIYPIYNDNENGFPVYCDMKSEPGNAWTLVMSWKTAKRGLVQFQKLSFKQNGPVNENAPNFNLYRLTLARMQSLKSHSTHWRATCSFPVNGVDYRDYVRGNFKDLEMEMEPATKWNM